MGVDVFINPDETQKSHWTLAEMFKKEVLYVLLFYSHYAMFRRLSSSHSEGAFGCFPRSYSDKRQLPYLLIDNFSA